MESALGYARTSTVEQAAEGVSIPAQVERIRAYCSLHELELVEVVLEEGVSGGKPLASREGGKTLLHRMKTDRVKNVIAVKLDRLFRDAVDALQQTESWDRAGIALHLIDLGGQSLNTASAMGRFFLSMTAAFAELERRMIGERTKAAMDHLRRNGRVYSSVPFGFDRDGEMLVVNRAEMRVVRQMKKWRDVGVTLREIADRLNKKGILTKRGSAWHPSTVRYVLRNTIGKGIGSDHGAARA